MTLKIMTITPSSGPAEKIINYEDVFDGFSVRNISKTPLAEGTLQNGDLILQTIRYTKQRYEVSFTTRGNITLHQYMQSLIVQATVALALKIHYEDSDWNELEEFDGTAHLVRYENDKDHTGNRRSMTATFQEA